MSKAKNLRVAFLIAAALASGSCGILKKGKAKTPVLGERIPVLTSENDAEVDPATQALPFTLPPAAENAAWAESGGSASNSMGHLALGKALQPAFTVQAGRGSSLTARLGAPPIIANGRAYTIDTLGAVRAFDARTGASVWSSQNSGREGKRGRDLRRRRSPTTDGRIYATNGLGFVAALSEQNGGIGLAGSSRRAAARRTDGRERGRLCDQPGQPDLFAQRGGRIDQLVAARLARGGRLESSAPRRPRSGRGRSSPAFRRESSTAIATRTAGRSGRTSSPTDQHPHQRLVAIRHRRRSGDRQRTGVRDRRGRTDGCARHHLRPALWELNIAGISTPWVAGDWVFVVTTDAKLLVHLPAERTTSAGSTSCRSSKSPSRRRATSTIPGRCSPATS